MKRYFWLIVVLVVAVVYGVFKARQTSNTVKVGVIFPLSVNAVVYGEPARDAVILAEEAVNQRGGINGKKLQLIIEDSQFDPKIALSAYQSLKLRGVQYFLTLGSTVSVAVSKVVAQDRNFEFEVSAVTPAYTDGNPTTCRVSLTATVSGKALGEFVVNGLKAKRVALLGANDEYPLAMFEAVSKVISSAGGKIIAQELFDKNNVDFRTHITKLKALENQIDALVVITPFQNQRLFQELKELNWKKQIVSDNFTIINRDLRDLSLVEGVYLSNYAWQDTLNDSDPGATKDFKQSFRQKYNYDPPIIAALAYDDVIILARGLSATSDGGPETVANWLVGNVKNYDGAAGTVSLNPDCEAERDVIIQKVQSGKFVKI